MVKLKLLWENKLLSKKRILVTGANSKIGSSISKTLLENNANLILFYHENHDSVDRLKELFNSSCETYKVNLLDDSQTTSVITSILEKDDIDCFIHCISLPFSLKNILDLDWDNFLEHIQLQTKSFLKISQLIIPKMKAKKYGKIISIISTSTLGKPPSNMSDYVVSKYSLLGISRCLAVEMARFNITVNCISPSFIETNLTKVLPSKFKEISLNQSTLGREITPQDVANTALSLLSENSDNITGENIVVS